LAAQIEILPELALQALELPCLAAEFLLLRAAVGLAQGQAVFLELPLQGLDLLLELAQILLARREFFSSFLVARSAGNGLTIDAIGVDEPDFQLRGLCLRCQAA